MPTMILLILIFLVAMMYASVGHGGASGYLAAMSLVGVAPAQMASSALLLNVLVAGTACLMFWRAGHGSMQRLWPFLIGSVPAAFVGGRLLVSARAYGWLLAVALLVAAVRLSLPSLEPTGSLRRPAFLIAVSVGAGIGWLSGILGVGGGIFLSPLMLLLRWAGPKPTAAASAGFIVVNSAAGLAGRVLAGRWVIGSMCPLVVAAFAGGVIGSRLGANHFSGVWVRRLLAVVLVVATGKLVMSHA
ncbi:MAG: sulfite exporter TauE/SafE family protein [Candidatus Omnitrophica bacterium]|nr:sulfite exporter TauE/SafE family protein [Candidatus Omnitrophota bacterium]